MSSFVKMSLNRQQLQFNPELIFSSIKEWKKAAEIYDRAAENHYKRIRSYLTLWQFRLDDDQKCDIREKLAQHLDELTENDFIQDLDSYLEGFCFQLDKSVLPSQGIKPKEVKIEIAQPPPPPNSPAQQNTQNFSDQLFTETLDCNDLDYYTLQFFQ